MKINLIILIMLIVLAWYGLVTFISKLTVLVSDMMDGRWLSISIFGYKKRIYIKKEIILNKILSPFDCEIVYVNDSRYYSGRWKTIEAMMAYPSHSRGAQAPPNARMTIRKKPTGE
jgi:hypothetical protein